MIREHSHLTFRNYLGKRLHLGVCGSVAAYKALDLLRDLVFTNASVSATLTGAAQEFVRPLSFEALGAAPVWGGMWPPAPDLYGHLEPAQNADAMVIAPASASTLARLACGLADDMLSCQALAFGGPVVVAPAMNPRMWQAPATRENWDKLLARGVVGVVPDSGTVACGEEGQGRLADLRAIGLAALKAVTRQDMAGRKVLVDLGPTQEPWDALRYWTNPSTGLMGGAMAVAAWLRGARVTVVRGPVGCDSLWLPTDIRQLAVQTAAEMFAAVTELWPSQDIACLTAAVADFRPEPYAGVGKFKKAEAPEGFSVRFLPNADILAHLGRNKAAGQRLIGFAAETGDASALEAAARAKLAAKNLDLIAANPVGRADAGFGSPTNQVVVLETGGRLETWPVLPKTEVAWRLWDIATGW